MSVRQSVMRQYQAIVNDASGQWDNTVRPVPSEGWITTMRKALGMSGAQLAARLGLSRARVSQAARAEREGAVTLKTMQSMAEAMGGRFVYAIVPPDRVEHIVKAQAEKKARAVVKKASTHMALEDQSLRQSRNAEEIERLVAEYLRRMPADLWSEP